MGHPESAGLADAAPNGLVEEFVGLGAEPSVQIDSIVDILSRDPAIDAVYGHGWQTPLSAAEAAKQLDRPLLIGGQAVTPDLLDAVDRGDVQFLVDDQPYLQGFLPIVFLSLTASTGAEVAPGSHADTGGGFIDASNIGVIQELYAAGTR